MSAVISSEPRYLFQRVFDPLSMINVQVFVGGKIWATAVVIIKGPLDITTCFWDSVG
jgi:hypothetical protein